MNLGRMSRLLLVLGFCLTSYPWEGRAQEYPVCKKSAIHRWVRKLSKKTEGNPFEIQFIQDKVAQYHYYLVTIQGDVNADLLRGKVCEFINEKKCKLYWGNVANIGMFSDQKAAWFPADTSPHYQISPSVTCDRFKSQKGE